MMKQLYILMILALGLWACSQGENHAEKDEMGSKTPKVEKKPDPKIPDEFVPLRKGVEFNLAQKKVRITGKVVNNGILDFFGTSPHSPGGHETVMFLDCVPSDLHTALLMIGAEDAESAEAKGDTDFEGDRFKCDINWDQVIRYAKVEVDSKNKDLKPEKLYVIEIEKPGTDYEWLMLCSQKIEYDAAKGEGRIRTYFEFPELLDPEDPEAYIWNHIREAPIVDSDKQLYYFHQPDKKKKGVFKPYGKLVSIRDEIVPRKAPLEKFLISANKPDTPYSDVQWKFLGSGTYRQVDPDTDEITTGYRADRSGFVMTLIYRGPTVLMADSKEPLIYGDVSMNRKFAPPAGTKLSLELRLLPRKEKVEKEVEVEKEEGLK